MVGRVAVWPGWPVDPRRSAGPAPHRPPRGAISRTRAPGSSRPGDRLTPGFSPPSHQPTNRRTCLRRPAAPITTFSLIASQTRTYKHPLKAPPTARSAPLAQRKLGVSARLVIRLRKRIHTFLRSRRARMRGRDVF
ncbi:unnamed protein product [Pieris brassicae]|uniref:Uncharacterized protein n=1 Tax=Pieris brassicae TaxID=7116 RepID=A0A9P0TF30_PIEBR|nr:unnamed protein product [Pieris brassicae]